jgi:hypothetical protein
MLNIAIIGELKLMKINFFLSLLVIIMILIDTGSTLNILDEPTYNTIASEVTLSQTKSIAWVFQGKQPIEFICEFSTTVKCHTKEIEALFVVVRGKKKCILGYNTASQLGIVRIINNVNEQRFQHQLESEFPNVFRKQIGRLKDFEVKLNIDPSVRPVALKHRRIPFHMRKSVEVEIERLLKDDIIEPVTGPTPWLLPAFAVPKKDGNIRLVVDAKPANKAILRTRHVIPTVDELITEVNGANVFSKIDIKSGFHQLVLSEESRDVTTFSHVGVFRHKRLIMGITSAPEIFQNTLETKVVRGLPGIRKICDDMAVYGKDEAEHDERLRALFKRMNDCDLTINLEKCQFKQIKVNFFGLIFSASGVRLAEDKVKALLEANPPTTKGELHSLFGLSTYCSRFIENYASIVEPLRKLARKDTKLDWGLKEDVSLNKLKAALTTKALAYFNPDLETELIVAASPIGLGAVLMQIDLNALRHVISYGSRELTPVEFRYSQLEKEGLATVWGVEKYHLYLYGNPFVLVTDNKALAYKYNSRTSKTPARIERWCLRLAPYDFIIIHHPGKGNPSDYLSRNPVLSKISDNECAEEYINYLFNQSIPKSLTHETIIFETKADPTLQCLICRLCGNKVDEVGLKVTKQFDYILNEFSVAENGVVMRGPRIVTTESLQEKVIELAHEGHQGLTKTKQLLRLKVWFFKMDGLVENKITCCTTCQINHPRTNYEPFIMSTIPKVPWDTLDLNFFPTVCNMYLLVILDEYSRFVIVKEVSSTSSELVIPAIHEVISTFGIPSKFKTDNGPPFNGKEFERFCSVFCIKDRQITP